MDLGRFVDARDGTGVVLGSIKNELGVPIKKLTTRKPVAELVHNSVGYGLKVRGMLVDKGKGRYLIGGTITEFYAHQLASQESGCTINFQVFRRGEKKPLFARPTGRSATGGRRRSPTGAMSTSSPTSPRPLCKM